MLRFQWIDLNHLCWGIPIHTTKLVQDSGFGQWNTKNSGFWICHYKVYASESVKMSSGWFWLQVDDKRRWIFHQKKDILFIFFFLLIYVICIVYIAFFAIHTFIFLIIFEYYVSFLPFVCERFLGQQLEEYVSMWELKIFAFFFPLNQFSLFRFIIVINEWLR